MKETVFEVFEGFTGTEALDALCGLASREEGYVLAVDFDGTLCDDEYPEIGLPNEELIIRLRIAKTIGIKLILWTCREGDKLDEAVQWCKWQGLGFDAVNDNIPERKALYGNNPRKVGYDELWDDRAVPV